MKALELHCVSVKNPSKIAQDKIDAMRPIPELDDLVVRLHLANPNWMFEFVASSWGEKLVYLQILQDRENLGTVEWSYLTRKMGYGFQISNNRIAEKMERGNAYRTSNPDKAFTKIKKMFGAKTRSEIMAKAEQEVWNIVQKNLSTKRLDRDCMKRVIHAAATKYIITEGFHHFLAYVDNGMDPLECTKVKDAMHKQDELDRELAPIATVYDAVNAHSAVILVRVSDGYMCRESNEVMRFITDADMPEEWRGKLGMLKLVEKEHYVEGVGCRASDEVFVVLK